MQTVTLSDGTTAYIQQAVKGEWSRALGLLPCPIASGKGRPLLDISPSPCPLPWLVPCECLRWDLMKRQPRKPDCPSWKSQDLALAEFLTCSEQFIFLEWMNTAVL